jgi:hypothetical protein
MIANLNFKYIPYLTNRLILIIFKVDIIFRISLRYFFIYLSIESTCIIVDYLFDKGILLSILWPFHFEVVYIPKFFYKFLKN